MRATVKFMDGNKLRQKTLTVSTREPNAILREFYNSFRYIPKNTYVKTIKCGTKTYIWEGELSGAGIY